MNSEIAVRPASLNDVPRLAQVHVESWRETYRGLMPDSVLDDPDFLTQREQFWTAALTEERYRDNRTAVALSGREVVGIAMSGPSLDDDADWDRQLYVLYTLAVIHGQGGGGALLAAVIDEDASTGLWVADPNPRAQAFYRKHGFDFDGVSRVDDGVRAVRMVRPPTLRWISTSASVALVD